MRRLILQMNITLDGFVADPEGKLDWMLMEADERQVSYLHELTQNIDTIIMGSNMAKEAVQHWENTVKKQGQGAEFEYANLFVNTQKIVFSKSLKHMSGKNISVKNGDLQKSITQLKSKPGKDIIVYGGARFVSSLIRKKLIDEMNLFIHPVSIGDGLRIFSNITPLKLIKSDGYSNGIVLSKYKLKV